MEQELAKQLQALQKEVTQIKRTLSTHQHGGTDNTERVYNEEVRLKTGQTLDSGASHFSGGTIPALSGDIDIGGFTVGKDKEVDDGFNNAQFILQHRSEDDTNRISYIYGTRPPTYSGSKGAVSSGESALVSSEFSFKNNELTNAYLVAVNPDTLDSEGYQITSNTSKSIIVDGSWGFTSPKCSWFVFMPIYLGFSVAPWRRLYLMEGSGGGIRFGFGTTGAGSNGLLYMDSSGNLIWRTPAGSTSQLN